MAVYERFHRLWFISGKKNGTGTEAPIPVPFPVSFCAVNSLAPGLPILRIFTEKGAPVFV